MHRKNIIERIRTDIAILNGKSKKSNGIEYKTKFRLNLKLLSKLKKKCPRTMAIPFFPNDPRFHY